MEFTYDAYRAMLELLAESGYTVCDYHNYTDAPRCVILRHDIDNSLSKALRLAELETDFGVKSTYFTLLRTDFYNPASASGTAFLRRIHELGHEIGLHFDETAYPNSSISISELICREAAVLSSICGFPITTVSMHRPSKATLDADLKVPGMINSYGKTFFHDFKYLSDSRRHWREPVLDIIRDGSYDRLHILTHAFWYNETEEGITETVRKFICAAKHERFLHMAGNIKDIGEIINERELFDETGANL